jgi:hypothetical protein
VVARSLTRVSLLARGAQDPTPIACRLTHQVR